MAGHPDGAGTSAEQLRHLGDGQAGDDAQEDDLGLGRRQAPDEAQGVLGRGRLHDDIGTVRCRLRHPGARPPPEAGLTGALASRVDGAASSSREDPGTPCGLVTREAFQTAHDRGPRLGCHLLGELAAEAQVTQQSGVQVAPESREGVLVTSLCVSEDPVEVCADHAEQSGRIGALAPDVGGTNRVEGAAGVR